MPALTLVRCPWAACTILISADVLRADETTPLAIAAAEGSIEAVRLLCEANANVNEVNVEGFAPLHAAAQEVPAQYLLRDSYPI